MLVKKPKMILIDLDGTLVDSVPDLAYCVDVTMERVGREPWGEARVREWVGNGVERLVKRALVGALEGEPAEADYTQALPIFMAVYADNVSGRSTLYPGVTEGLEQLKAQGYRVCCVTNKAAQFTEPLLRDMGIAHQFELIVSGDTTAKKKPDPMPLLYAAERLGIDPADSLMVGDSQNDVTAARQAGFQVVCLPYGYNHGQDIRLAAPDAVIERLDELPALLAPLAGG
ncbi:MAG: phosphoglycolate phosphatase [Halothiobacillaceae bacterium]|nr:MAG: phosphoglycolate phosphatase [Halothiobacillaceae bacterium]